MPAYDRELEKFAGLDAQVVGIAGDSVYSHMAWQQKEIGLLHYPLCSDFYPHAETAQKYGIMRMGPPQPGISERTIVIVDKQGIVAFAKVYPLDEVPEIEEIFDALRGLSTPARAAV
ncbi:MAG: redoxin domain-containing protein [Acidobacteria bacterium]|nr:redoxin domain-containing protein [Acidobacteriota bacterium]